MHYLHVSIARTSKLNLSAPLTVSLKSHEKPCACAKGNWAATHRSWEVSQSTKVTRVLCTFSDSAVGVDTGGGAWWLDEEPFIISGCCGTSAVPLSGREIRTAVSRHAAFSCVNQSVRCSSLRAQHANSQRLPSARGPTGH